MDPTAALGVPEPSLASSLACQTHDGLFSSNQSSSPIISIPTCPVSSQITPGPPLQITTTLEDPTSIYNKRRCDSGALATAKSQRADVGTLCSYCREINLERLINLNMSGLRRHEKGQYVTSFRTWYPQVDCPLCQVWRSLLGQVGTSPQDRELRVFSFLKKSGVVSCQGASKEARRGDIPCLILCSDGTNMPGYLFCVKRDKEKSWTFQPQSLDRKTNLARCKEWLEYCRANHRRLCDSQVDWPSGIRFIDCNTREVIPGAEGFQYIALSYVWGSGHAAQSNDYPRTIRDAIEVTRSLGYRYLWVDKYCIDQHDAEDKHRQISAMDLIYRAADLTIIAAAGDGADAGLPGVLDTTRIDSPVFEVGEYDFIQCPPHPHETIPKTKWWTRAWTLQESVLSRRRLVFTSEQTYFECTAKNCCEALQENRSVLDSKNKTKAKRFCHSGIFEGGYSAPFEACDVKGSAHRRVRLARLISQYTSRSLSFEHDSLNAFAGILRHIWFDDRVSHIWGLEFMTEDEILASSLEFFGITWWHKSGKHIPAPVRRKEFPSFTWVGWSGEVAPDRAPSQRINHQKVWLEIEEGSWVSLFHLLQSLRRSEWALFSQPKAILFEAMFVDCAQIRSISAESLDVGGSFLDLYWSIGPARLESSFQNGEYTLMLLDDRARFKYLLILREEADCFARVGLALHVGDILDKSLLEGPRMFRIK